MTRLDPQLPSGNASLSIFNVFPPRQQFWAMLPLSLSSLNRLLNHRGIHPMSGRSGRAPIEAVHKKKIFDGRCTPLPWRTPTDHRTRTQLPPSAGPQSKKEVFSLPVASRSISTQLPPLYLPASLPLSTLSDWYRLANPRRPQLAEDCIGAWVDGTR